MRHIDSSNTRSLNTVAGGGRVSMVTVRGPAGLNADGTTAEEAMTDVDSDAGSTFRVQQDARQALPKAGSYDYDTEGRVETDAAGVAYTYDSEGRVQTATLGAVTRTITYNTDGTIASVA